MAIPVVGSAALRTVFIRQVKARSNGAVGNKLAVMAFGAHIMRAQWVYLGNTGHGGHKAGTNGTTGAYQIAVGLRVRHQLLSSHIQH